MQRRGLLAMLRTRRCITIYLKQVCIRQYYSVKSPLSLSTVHSLFPHVSQRRGQGEHRHNLRRDRDVEPRGARKLLGLPNPYQTIHDQQLQFREQRI